jgi:hypothetical protein
MLKSNKLGKNDFNNVLKLITIVFILFLII